MAQISFKQLEAFVHVVDMGSFRGAAAKLNTTQPNISSRISTLETLLNVKLLERDAGSVRLTKIGAALLPKARQVIRSLDDFIVTAGDDQLFDNVLHLGVTEMIVHSWLGQYLSALNNRFPNVEVDLTVDFSANLTEALSNRSIDLALQSEPFSRQSSGGVELGRFPLVWIGSPSLGIGSRRLTQAELAGYAIITHARGTVPFEQIERHFAATPDLQVRIVPSSNSAACIQMAIEGLGIACLPEVMVKEELTSGKLEKLKYAWSPDPLRFQARYDAATAPHFVAEAAKLAGQVSLNK